MLFKNLLFHCLPTARRRVFVIVAFHCTFGELLRLLQDILRNLLVSSLRWAVQRAHPRHLQFEFLVFAILVCDVYYPCGFFDALFQRKTPRREIELLQFGFCGLPSFPGRGTIVPLSVSQ